MTELSLNERPGPQLRRRLYAMYSAARGIAARVLRGKSDYSWGRTDLANEAMKRLLSGSWAERVRQRPEETVRTLRTVVRRTLVDYERSQRLARQARGGGRTQVPWNDELLADEARELDTATQRAWLLETIRRGSTELRLTRPDAVVEVAELCLLLGLSQREAAALTGIPQTTVSNWMRMLRVWLRRELHPTG